MISKIACQIYASECFSLSMFTKLILAESSGLRSRPDRALASPLLLEEARGLSFCTWRGPGGGLLGQHASPGTTFRVPGRGSWKIGSVDAGRPRVCQGPVRQLERHSVNPERATALFIEMTDNGQEFLLIPVNIFVSSFERASRLKIRSISPGMCSAYERNLRNRSHIRL
jgi:hypothetical protein